MKKSNKIVLLVIAIILIFSITLICYYDSDKKQLVLKHYSPDTKRTDSLEYVIRNGDTVFHGKFTTYNEKGIKIAEGNMVNGHVKGKCIYYYDNGKIESIFYRKNANIAEESTKYYANGNVKRYTLYDPKGLACFVINYDEQGNVKDYDGYPIIETYQFKFSHKAQFNIEKNQYLKVGDTIKYKYLIANIPNSKQSLFIESLGLNNSKVKRVLKKTPATETDVTEIANKQGLNTIRGIVKYEFNDKRKTVIQDTISFDVMVN
ncbi:toxin-antitoxin system YwqK family antitoxin [Flavobacterium sp.]|uniref:toxin-antitoxin system YwqK family antitoxin n=1 Tax=Flavobacterium sp. TaxID=239 RepID=UPI00391912AB